jgi:hypothetical protein
MAGADRITQEELEVLFEPEIKAYASKHGGAK